MNKRTQMKVAVKFDHIHVTKSVQKEWDRKQHRFAIIDAFGPELLCDLHVILNQDSFEYEVSWFST